MELMEMRFQTWAKLPYSTVTTFGPKVADRFCSAQKLRILWPKDCCALQDPFVLMLISHTHTHTHEKFSKLTVFWKKQGVYSFLFFTAGQAVLCWTPRGNHGRREQVKCVLAPRDMLANVGTGKFLSFFLCTQGNILGCLQAARKFAGNENTLLSKYFLVWSSMCSL